MGTVVIDRAPAETRITGGTNIGSATGGGGLAAADDGITVQASAACALASSVGALGGTWGKNHGVPKLVSRARAVGSSDVGFQGGNAGNYEFQGWNGSSWVAIASGAYPTSTTSPEIDLTSGLGSTSYTQHRFALDGNGGDVRFAEVELYEFA